MSNNIIDDALGTDEGFNFIQFRNMPIGELKNIIDSTDFNSIEELSNLINNKKLIGTGLFATSKAWVKIEGIIQPPVRGRHG